MNRRTLVLGVFLLFSAATPSAGQVNMWVMSQSQSCQAVCGQLGLYAVALGEIAGQPAQVCRAEIPGTPEYRAGFTNTVPGYPLGCAMYGGDSGRISPVFQCLCTINQTAP